MGRRRRARSPDRGAAQAEADGEGLERARRATVIGGLDVGDFSALAAAAVNFSASPLLLTFWSAAVPWRTTITGLYWLSAKHVEEEASVMTRPRWKEKDAGSFLGRVRSWCRFPLRSLGLTDDEDVVRNQSVFPEGDGAGAVVAAGDVLHEPEQGSLGVERVFAVVVGVRAGHCARPRAGRK